jgi:hypothetical protein
MVRVFLSLILATFLISCDTYPKPEFPTSATPTVTPEGGWRNYDYQHQTQLRVWIDEDMRDSAEEIWDAMAWWNGKIGCELFVYEHNDRFAAEVHVAYRLMQTRPALAVAGYKLLGTGDEARVISQILVYPVSYSPTYYPILEHILRHEFGHVAGLPHFPKASNIMHSVLVPDVTVKSEVSSQTLNALRMRYCPRFLNRRSNKEASDGKNLNQPNPGSH